MIKQDILENQVRSIYLGIGSNLGNKKKNIEKAKFELTRQNIRILKTSGYFETPSWPNPKNPRFINIVLKVKALINPIDLLNLCKSIEKKLGRKKSLKNSPRECDIDIIDFQGLIMKGKLNLPHVSMHKRNFVLFPLFDIEKDWFHPSLKHNIKKLLLSLSNKDIRSIKKT